MTTLAGQSLVRHIENGDLSTCVQILQSGAINMEDRDDVRIMEQFYFTGTGSAILIITGNCQGN